MPIDPPMCYSGRLAPKLTKAHYCYYLSINQIRTGLAFGGEAVITQPMTAICLLLCANGGAQIYQTMKAAEQGSQSFPCEPLLVDKLALPDVVAPLAPDLGHHQPAARRQPHNSRFNNSRMMFVCAAYEVMQFRQWCSV